MDIRIDASSFEAIVDAWAKIPEVTRAEMLAAVTEADHLLEREVKERTPTAVGAGGGLRGSIASDEQAHSDRVIGMVGSPLNYAVPVELGTRPHFPPLQPLEDWVRAKLDVPDAQVRNVAFLIARKISKVGTQGAHMFEEAFDATADQVEKIFSLGVQRITEQMASA